MNTPEDVRPDVLARALEERGFDSLFIGEHSHIPASRMTPYPAGGEMPKQYTRMMDPFVSLTVAATATESLKLGLGVALPLEHDLMDLAKSASTLDVLSGGRLLFGVGVGWNVEELANHRPIPWRMRYRALEDCVSALRSLWQDENSEHHGEFYDFDAVWSFPKPAQQPSVPVLMGAGGKLGTQHAVRWADEWMPIDISLGFTPERVEYVVGKFRAAATEAGRGEIPVTMIVFGDPTFDLLKRYKELGIQRVVLGSGRAKWDEPDTTLAFLDHYSPMISDLA